MEKTNVMRLLDSKKIVYEIHEYDDSIDDGMTIAQTLNEDPNRVFKTLVTISNTNEHFVFMVPVCKQLDLKKCAKAAGCKNIAMILQKELLPLTGYVHGGCSPIGMKKRFKTFIDESALNFDKIIFSGGKRGHQVELKSDEISKYVITKYSDLCL